MSELSRYEPDSLPGEDPDVVEVVETMSSARARLRTMALSNAHILELILTEPKASNKDKIAAFKTLAQFGIGEHVHVLLENDRVLEACMRVLARSYLTKEQMDRFLPELLAEVQGSA